MESGGIDKRRHKRIYFKTDNMLTGELLYTNNKKAPFKVNILNLSESGLCFSVEKSKKIVLEQGDHLILLKFEGSDLLDTITDVDMVVRWTMSLDELEYNMNGCQFINIMLYYQIQLREFIYRMTSTKGQIEN